MSVPDCVVLPDCARRVEFALAAGPIAALEARPAGAVTASALLVPGFTGSKEDFLPLLEPLAAAGVRVVAIDQRGQSESPGLSAADGYGVETFGTDIRALMGLVADGGPLHLLGHSFGGHAVREALLGAAEPLCLASVTLLGSGPAEVLDATRGRLEQFLAVSQTLTLRQIHELEPVDGHPDPQVRAFLLRRWLANDPAALHAMARHLLDGPDRTDELRELLSSAALPCLVVTGVDEDVWPAELQRRMAERLGAQFAAIPGAGHSPNTQQPEALAKTLLNFWTG